MNHPITVDAHKLLLVVLAQGRHRHDRPPEHGTARWKAMRQRQLDKAKAECLYCQARDELQFQLGDDFADQP